MNYIFTNVLTPIFTAIIGSVVGVFTEKLILKNRNNIPSNINIADDINNKQVTLNYNQIHIEQNEIIKKNIKRRTSVKPTSSNGDGEIIIFAIIALILVYLYLKYEYQIFLGLSIAVIFIASLCLSAIYIIAKNNIKFDKDFSKIIIFIIMSIILIPLNIYFLENPCFFNWVNKKDVFLTMKSNGILSLLTSYKLQVFEFLLFQVSGIILLILFILLLVIANIHILSSINIALESRLIRLWSFLYKKTVRFIKTSNSFIVLESIFMIIILLLTSGALARLLSTAF